jgi:hypothetical protein
LRILEPDWKDERTLLKNYSDPKDFKAPDLALHLHEGHKKKMALFLKTWFEVMKA